MATLVKDTDTAYHAVKALSNSGIGKMLECPAIFKAWQDGGLDEKTKALDLGHLFHSLVLEPETVGKYSLLKYQGNTKAGKEERKEAEEQGKITVSAKDWDAACSMRDALLKKPFAKLFFSQKSLQTEQSLYWEETVNGVSVPCKLRLDAMANIPRLGIIPVDLKSSLSANPEELPKKIYDYGYHRQAAWYLHGLQQVGIHSQVFVFFFCEKDFPYLVTPITLKQDAIEYGWQQCQAMLESYAQCVQDNYFPCYSNDIIEIDLPHWAYRRTA
ncbi:MAG: PD-(D/E)XK nuclease-like domain-containing protein [Desulfovibrionaceae bacterium]|nr:PD-(D/E)XK nuclease-like domain-containing protein [Desulfovibrionaceae bacterium]